MAFRRQHLQDPRRSQLTDHERRARPGLPHNGPDPVLFALATNLPMSHFPDDGVHSNAPWRTAEPHLYPLNRTCPGNRHGNCLYAHGQLCLPSDLTARGSGAVTIPELEANTTSAAHSTDYVRYHGANAPFPYVHDQFFHDYAIESPNIRDRVPPLSASTASLDGSSNWSLSESAPEICATPIDVCDSLLLERTYREAVPHEFIGDGAPFLPQNLPESDWNKCLRFTPSGAPVWTLRSFDIQKLGLDTTSTCLIECFDGGHFHLASPLHAPSDPAVYLPSPSDIYTPQPLFPSAEDDNPNDPTLLHTYKEVDDFLDELGSTIYWDNVEPSPHRDRTSEQTKTANPPLGNTIDLPSILKNDQHHSSPDLPDYVDSPHDSSNESPDEGTAFTDLANILDQREEEAAAAFLSSADDGNEVRL